MYQEMVSAHRTEPHPRVQGSVIRGEFLGMKFLGHAGVGPRGNQIERRREREREGERGSQGNREY